MPTTTEYRQVEFISDGATLRGRLYLPDRHRAPVVIMSHGFSATIPMTMDAYAERFRDHGLAVLAFDHRGHGTSEGEPKGEVNYWVQARGYIDALEFVLLSEDLEGSPVALWGDSLSTRTAIGVAALDDRIAALVCQVPALGDQTGPPDLGGARLDAIGRYLANGEMRGPTDMWVSAAVVSADQTSSPSSLTPLTAFRWFIEYGGRYGSGWTNRVMFTGPPEAPDFDPFVCAPSVRVPTLFVMSNEDEMPGCSSGVTKAVFELLAGPKDMVEVNGGHFGINEYPSDAFEAASEAQAEWLMRTLAQFDRQFPGPLTDLP